LTRVKNKQKIKQKIQKKIQKIQKSQKLTNGVDFNSIWSKLTVKTEWSHF